MIISKKILFAASIILIICFSSSVYSQKKSDSKIHRVSNKDVSVGDYGFAFDMTGANTSNFLKILLSAPGSQTIVGPSGGKRFYGDDFNTTNQLFAFDGSITDTSALYSIDTATGVSTLIGKSLIQITSRMTSITYDSTSSNWYAVAVGVPFTVLFKVNVTSGSLVFIGSVQNSVSVVSISFAKNGTLFGVDNINDNLIKINKFTGATTVVGPLGMSIASYQGMDFNPITGILYMTANTPSPKLLTIDTTTGTASIVGDLSGTASVTGFAIPFSG